MFSACHPGGKINNEGEFGEFDWLKRAKQGDHNPRSGSAIFCSNAWDEN